MPFLPLDALKAGACALGIDLTQSQLEQMDLFAQRLVEANSRFNLTRITAPEDIAARHYLDSLTCLAAAPFGEGAEVIDVGTGGGFPGIPVRIARPDLRITLLDGTFKKARFLQEAVSELGLDGCEVVHARAEELGRDESYRERFDVALARALARLNAAAELCLPFVRTGGVLIAQKGSEADAETAEARPIVGQLGGVVEKVSRVQIPGTDVTRSLVVIRKARPTPERFPRPYARIIRRKG